MCGEHDPRDGDAPVREVAERPVQKGGGDLLGFVGEHIGVGEARTVIDGNVQPIPSQARGSDASDRCECDAPHTRSFPAS